MFAQHPDRIGRFECQMSSTENGGVQHPDRIGRFEYESSFRLAQLRHTDRIGRFEFSKRVT